MLFSDIRGFTALSETMKPDEMASLLTEYFTEMVECVFRHGGTLDKFMGDAVMAQWGAPLGTSDDADHAMRAAIDMMHEMDELNARWKAAERPQLEIGIGLNYGEAFAGNIGSERRLEFTVIGDTVNTAYRLCAAAESGADPHHRARCATRSSRRRRSTCARPWSSRGRASRCPSTASELVMDDVPAGCVRVAAGRRVAVALRGARGRRAGDARARARCTRRRRAIAPRDRSRDAASRTRSRCR